MKTKEYPLQTSQGHDILSSVMPETERDQSNFNREVPNTKSQTLEYHVALSYFCYNL